ncbi:Uncharacterised protein [Mycoplasmopsis arginini]|uniref:Uncharacterized protein n=1 Tax=Mycoplasmopsis arginini TaxID=2094 RepID=A0A449BGW6_MYCAR|nr:hypothetical protein [Mycoplasmopsis arginini]SGA02907.1 Uncharacterised protein [Chlamydia abortus]SGA06141.1 Uncharacterised protein [Mycoplasmopsis arginini]SGA19326.1 Uncharacterised protein [Mycoplasmopsis arginini]SGA30968.1 Uncharacterised protein [Chlamydia abortus]
MKLIHLTNKYNLNIIENNKVYSYFNNIYSARIMAFRGS